MLFLLLVLTCLSTIMVDAQFCNPFGTPDSPTGCLLPDTWRLQQDPNDAQTCTDCATVKSDAEFCYYRTTDVAVGNERAYLTIADFNYGWSSLTLDASFQIRVGNGGSPGGEGFSFNWGPDLPLYPNAANGPDEDGYGDPRGTNSGLSFTLDTKSTGAGDFIGISINWNSVVYKTVVADPAVFLTYPDWSDVKITVDAGGSASFVFTPPVAVGSPVTVAQNLPSWEGLKGDFMIGAHSSAPAQYNDIANVQITLDSGITLNKACCTSDSDCGRWPGTVCSPKAAGGTGDCIIPFCDANDDLGCKKLLTPKCENPGQWNSVCGKCTTNDDCYRWPGTGCASDGSCVASIGCFNGASCTPETPVCASGSCSECVSDSDCSFWPGTVCSPKAVGGTGSCILPPCDDNDNSACSTTAPRCEKAGAWDATCGACEDDNDCYRWPNTVCYTSASADTTIAAGTCAPPTCSQNDDCTDDTKPHCAKPGKFDSACVGCVSNTDCYQWPGTVCYTSASADTTIAAGTCAAIMCSQNDDCTTVTSPLCSNPGKFNAACVGCTRNSDCYSWPGTVCYTSASADTTIAAGTCAAPICSQNDDCKDITNPHCSNPGKFDSACAGCVSDVDCYPWPGTVCYTSASADTTIAAGTCGAPICSQNDDCTDDTKPHCDKPGKFDSACVGCVSNTDCYQWPGTVCFTATQGSIQAGTCSLPICSHNDDCTDITNPHCANPGKYNSACVGCVSDVDCYPWPSTVCYTSASADTTIAAGTCGAPICSQNDDCTVDTNPHCSNAGKYNSACVGCVSNTDCYQWPNTVCFTSAFGTTAAGTCAQPTCSQNDDCSDDTKSHCNNPGSFDSTCVGCVSNTDCYQWPSTVCYLTTIGATSAGVCAMPECVQNDDCHDINNAHCSNPGKHDSACVTCVDDVDCYQWSNHVCATNGQCVKPECFQNDDCTASAPHCSNAGLFDAKCVGCLAENDCYPYPGTACAAAGENVGACVIPACYSKEDCTRDVAVCENAGKYDAMCVGCKGQDDCVLWPSTPYCDESGECAVGCYTDGQCANGWHCLEHVCVECIDSYHCFAQGQDYPICSVNNTCVMCVEDADCLGHVALFEACHSEYEEINGTDVQTVGRCVIDTYNKGLQISALILGSIGLFGLVIAIVMIVMSLVTKKD